MSPARKPILCYATDRRAFGPPAVSSTSFQDQLAPLRASISRAVTAGIDCVQIREKDLDVRSLLDLVRFAVAESGASRSRILVNDRLDVALAAGAAGVHLGEQSLPVEAVAGWRRSAVRQDFQIGASCHSLESARVAERDGADYVFFGPVFATPSKAAFGPPQGIDRLRDVCASVRVPVLAIGGVAAQNARSCIEAGAAGIAAIRLFQNAGNEAELVELVNAVTSDKR